MTKRIFDLILSFLGILILFPLFLFIAIIIKITDLKGSVFFKQPRVGMSNRDFMLYKFRTMKVNADREGMLTVGEKDNRITNFGYFMRKFKLDEFPQLFNVLKGEMSLVGPRPEVRKYVDHYTGEQLKVLSIKPGITDYASIEYIDENELLDRFENPEKEYLSYIMPAKLQLNLKYMEEMGFFTDLKIIFRTFRKIVNLKLNNNALFKR